MKPICLVIVSYNRPEYFRKCLESVSNAEFPEGTTIIMVDDCSTDPETIRLFNDFAVPNVAIVKQRNAVNKKIYGSLLLAFNMAFFYGYEVVTNIDSDALVKPNFLQVLRDLCVEHPGSLVTGFNSRNKNRDGSDRHPVVKEEGRVLYKKSVGGINFCFDKEAYDKYVQNTLQECIKKPGNWDHMACIKAMKDDNPVACITPSVIQHIGFDSSMNHTEAPDIAQDFVSLSLPNVTLVGVDCVDSNRLLKAVDFSCRDINFGAVKLFTSLPSKDPRFTKIIQLRNKEQYSHFMLKSLAQHIETSHCLVVQFDGFVLNYAKWDPDWLKYDYIGATWWYKDGMNVGNGGFSLRSKKLMDLIASDPHIKKYHPEDTMIGREYRPYLESKGIIFAPEEVANKFSIEAYSVPKPDNKYSGQFGFHGVHVDFTGTEYQNQFKFPRR